MCDAKLTANEIISSYNFYPNDRTYYMHFIYTHIYVQINMYKHKYVYLDIYY